MNNKEPDFVFNIQIPVDLPTHEEIQILGHNLEPQLEHLVSNDYLTREEAVAFIKFAGQMGSFLPFSMDTFVDHYRKSKEEKSKRSKVDEVRKNANDAKRIIV